MSKVEIAGAPRGVPAARRHREIHAFCRLFAPYESLDLIRAYLGTRRITWTYSGAEYVVLEPVPGKPYPPNALHSQINIERGCFRSVLRDLSAKSPYLFNQGELIRLTRNKALKKTVQGIEMCKNNFCIVTAVSALER